MNWFTGKQEPAKKEDPAAGGDQTNAELLKLVRDLSGHVQSLNGRMAQIESQVQQPAQPAAPQEPQEPQVPKKPSLADMPEEELSTLSRAELVRGIQDEILGGLEDVLKKNLKPVDERLNTFESTSRKKDLQMALREFVNEKDSDGNLVRPDWQDWAPDIQNLMKSQPGLTFKQAYTLVKNEAQTSDPERYAQVQEKYWPKPEEPQRQPFGGIYPSNIGIPNSEEVISLDDAAMKAFGEMMDEAGPLPLADDFPS